MMVAERPRRAMKARGRPMQGLECQGEAGRPAPLGLGGWMSDSWAKANVEGVEVTQ
jgi:hypothetical protein